MLDDRTQEAGASALARMPRTTSSDSGGPATRPSWKRRLLLAGGAVLAAILAAQTLRPVGALGATTIAALAGWRMEQRERQRPEPGLTQVQAALRAATLRLGMPAQLAVILGWEGYVDRALLTLGSPPARPGLDDVAALRHAVSDALRDKESWMTARALALSTALPAVILFGASKVNALSPFSFITGTVATTFAAPLLYRLAGKVRVWSTSEVDRERQATGGTRFQEEVSRAGLHGNMQPDLFNSGRWYRAEAMKMLEGGITAANGAPDLERGSQLLALAVVNLKSCFPELDIDPLWSEHAHLRLCDRFGNEDAYALVRSLVVEKATEHEVSAQACEDHLRALLHPRNERLASAARVGHV
jgi:hypothetical protein